MDLPSKPKVYIMIPSPIHKQDFYMIYKPLFHKSDEKINGFFPFLIPDINKNFLKLPKDQVIDLFTPMGGEDLRYPFLYADGIHPTTEGNRVIARTIYCHIETCKYGWEMGLADEVAKMEQRLGNPDPMFYSTNGITTK